MARSGRWSDPVAAIAATDRPNPNPLGSFGPMLSALGLDPDELAAMFEPDPEADTLADVIDAVDELRQAIESLAAGLAPVIALLDHNAGKLKRLGITVPGR